MHNGVGVLRQAHPKTHESNRVIAVPQFAADVIRQRLALIDPDDAEHLLFFSRKGTPLTPYNVRRTFRGILRNAGLEGMEITPHSFRRTGTMLLANELGIQAAADMLGHTSTSTTKAHYAEPDRTVKSEPATVLQRLAPPSSGDPSLSKTPNSEAGDPLVGPAGRRAGQVPDVGSRTDRADTAQTGLGHTLLCPHLHRRPWSVSVRERPTGRS